MFAFLQSPNSVVVCNHIGNFWRIRGSTYHSIECFRKALYFSPNDADALLNLAKVLFNLNYIQDAAILARRSLEMQPSEHNCWLQHFTLGEILRANGDLEEAGIHFRHVLDLNPSFELAELHLREIGSPSTSTTNAYTFLIIGLLVVVVLATVYFMTLTSEGRGIKNTRMQLWVDGKRPRRRPITWVFCCSCLFKNSETFLHNMMSLKYIFANANLVFQEFGQMKTTLWVFDFSGPRPCKAESLKLFYKKLIFVWKLVVYNKGMSQQLCGTWESCWLRL